MFELLFLFACLTALEVILEVDNFTALKERLNTLPDSTLSRGRAPHILALVVRLCLASSLYAALSIVSHSLGYQSASEHTHQNFRMLGGLAIVLIGIMLMVGRVFKATNFAVVRPLNMTRKQSGATGALIVFLFLDAILSLDSIVATVAMTNSFGVAVAAMCAAAMIVMACHDKLDDWLRVNPRMITYAYLLITLLGVNLVLNAFGVHIPKTILLPLAVLCFWLNGLEKILLKEAPDRSQSKRKSSSRTIPAVRAGAAPAVRAGAAPAVCAGAAPGVLFGCRTPADPSAASKQLKVTRYGTSRTNQTFGPRDSAASRVGGVSVAASNIPQAYRSEQEEMTQAEREYDFGVVYNFSD